MRLVTPLVAAPMSFSSTVVSPKPTGHPSPVSPVPRAYRSPQRFTRQFAPISAASRTREPSLRDSAEVDRRAGRELRFTGTHLKQFRQGSRWRGRSGRRRAAEREVARVTGGEQRRQCRRVHQAVAHLECAERFAQQRFELVLTGTHEPADALKRLSSLVSVNRVRRSCILWIQASPRSSTSAATSTPKSLQSPPSAVKARCCTL